MSKLARALGVGVLVMAMSLGGIAYAQDSEAQSQPAGITQSDSSQPQPPGESDPQESGTPEDPAGSQDPGTPENSAPPGGPVSEDPAPSAGPSSTSGPTTTTHLPVIRPKSLPVTVSPRAGALGTTVMLTADLHGCTRPGSATGFFLDRLGYGVDGASRRLVREHVTGDRWYSAQYLVTNQDAVGQGQFGVACDFNLPTATQGHATFRVQPSRSPVPVRVTPQAAGRGTTVRITADVARCERLHIWFYDSKSDGLTQAGGAKPITPQRVTDAGRFTASYTLTRRDAIGPARFRVVCGLDIDHVRVGEANLRVLASNGQPSGGYDQTVNRNDRSDGSQMPSRVDTGLGGTADDGQGGLDPTRLLLPAGLLLIVIGAGLGLRQAARSRR